MSGPPAAGRRAVAGLDDRPMLMLAAGVVVFSTAPVLVAASSTTGPVLSFWRLWIGAALLAALTLCRARARARAGVVGGAARTGAPGWWWMVAAGLAFGVHQVFFMTAIKATSVVDVTLVQVLQPFIVGALAVVMFAERPGLSFRAWSLVAMAGAVLVVLAGTTGPQGDPVGMSIALGSTFFFALYFVASKRAMSHVDAVRFLCGVAVVAGLAVSAYVLLAGEPVSGIGRSDLLLAGLIAVVPGTLGHFLSTHPLARVPANVPPVMQLAMPWIAGGLAWLLLGQTVSWLHLGGGLLTVAGVLGALSGPGGRRLRASAAGDSSPAVAGGTPPSGR